MTIAENIAERLSYKAYSSAVITAGTEADTSTDPGASGGQILRHVNHTLGLQRDVFRSSEKRTDRQRGMGRLGMRRAPGQINGVLSPATYKELFEASLQGTLTAGISLTPTGVTSIACSANTITLGGGDPVSSGLRVGHVMRFTNLADTDNNAKNFLVTGFSGGSNRTIGVYPSPDTMTADTSFSLDVPGKTLIRPTSSHVSRKFALEVYNSDVDIARLYTEGRFGGFQLGLPATDNASINFQFMGRNRELFTTSSAPYFTAPTAQTTTGFVAGVNGLLMAAGSAVGVITGANVNYAMAPVAPAVVGSLGLVPEIFLPEASIEGEFSAFLTDTTFLANFDAETELSLLLYLTVTEAVNSPAMTVFLPRIKLTSNDESDGEGGKVIRCAFEAATYEGSTAGIPATAIQICDTEA